jgi:hypothetical protein
MTASGTGGEAPRQEPSGRTAWYIYGIVPAGGPVGRPAPGVGDPAGRVTLVDHGEVAALVSEVDVTRPLGTPEDLLAHQRVIDEANAAVPVLPMRFGSVVSDPEAVSTELLEPYHDEFAEALEAISGRVQYVISGRYDGQAILTEVLDSEPEAAGLRQEIHGRDEAATRPARVRLGEIVGGAIEARREADTEEAAKVIEPLSQAIADRDPVHEFQAVHLAVLADRDRQAELEQAFDRLTSGWAPRVELRVLGPMAPYDFVSSPELEG